MYKLRYFGILYVILLYKKCFMVGNVVDVMIDIIMIYF